MTHTEYLARLSLDTAGTLTRLGAQVLAATSINGRPWVKARLPARISPRARVHLLAAAWQCPAAVEWRTR